MSRPDDELRIEFSGLVAVALEGKPTAPPRSWSAVQVLMLGGGHRPVLALDLDHLKTFGDSTSAGLCPPAQVYSSPEGGLKLLVDLSGFRVRVEDATAEGAAQASLVTANGINGAQSTSWPDYKQVVDVTELTGAAIRKDVLSESRGLPNGPVAARVVVTCGELQGVKPFEDKYAQGKWRFKNGARSVADRGCLVHELKSRHARVVLERYEGGGWREKHRFLLQNKRHSDRSSAPIDLALYSLCGWTAIRQTGLADLCLYREILEGHPEIEAPVFEDAGGIVSDAEPRCPHASAWYEA